MKQRIALLSLVIFLFLPANTFAQAPSDAFSLSISGEQTAFELYAPVKVRGKIENKSRHKASFSGGRIELKRYECQSRCIRDDCFTAGFAFPKEKSLKSGESVEFEVDLNTLYWKDTISSTLDPTEPKNMSWTVPRGEYYLCMSLHVPAKNSKKDAHGLVPIKSNEILIKFGVLIG